MRCFIVQSNPIIGDLKGNYEKIISSIETARTLGADLIVFPEMTLPGYSPKDLMHDDVFIDECDRYLNLIVNKTADIAVVLGTIRRSENHCGKKLYNTAAIVVNGHLLGFQDKTLLPTYDVFDEARYFHPSSRTFLWSWKEKRLGITICEDMWVFKPDNSLHSYEQNPLDAFKGNVDLLINLSASPYHLHKKQQRWQVCEQASLYVGAPLLHVNQVGAQDGIIFDGGSLICYPQEGVVHSLPLFEEYQSFVDLEKHPMFHLVEEEDEISSLWKALVLGVRDYFHKQGFQKACIGISGGIDSAVVAAIAAQALGKENVLGVVMPSRYSSLGSVIDGWALIHSLGICGKEVSIEPLFESFLKTFENMFEENIQEIVKENIQSRIRGALLMAFSNQRGALVLNTGNKSELAFGYCTLYGDMCGALSVIGDVTKLNVYQLARYLNQKSEKIPLSIIEKAPSAELKPDQKDSDTLPDYSWIEQFLEMFVEKQSQKMSEEDVSLNRYYRWVCQNEYKRRQAPLILKVTKKSFGIGRDMPIVQKYY